MLCLCQTAALRQSVHTEPEGQVAAPESLGVQGDILHVCGRNEDDYGVPCQNSPTHAGIYLLSPELTGRFTNIGGTVFAGLRDVLVGLRDVLVGLRDVLAG
jgi:hypothetical protein